MKSQCFQRCAPGLVLVLLGVTAGCDVENGLLAGEPDRIPNELSATMASGTGCSTLSSMPGPDLLSIDTSTTPRSNASAEILAIEASRETTAPTALYERIVAELAGLASQFPDRANQAAHPCYSMDTLLLGISDSSGDALQAAEVVALNEKLKLLSSHSFDFINAIEMTFDGRYNAVRVAEQYEKLGIFRHVEPNYIHGDQSDLCLEVLGSDHLYIFDTGIGDCTNGCFSHDYDGFSIDKDGNITDLGSYSRFDGSAREPEPDWFTSALECRAFL